MLSLKIGIKNFLKGYLIGIGAVIPGVSGGTTAILVGAFEDILESIANFFFHISQSIRFLLPTMFGICLGVYLFSIPIDLFCEYFPTYSKLSFCAISLFSTLYFIKANKINIKHNKSYRYLIIGALCSIFIIFLLHFNKNYTYNYNNITLFLCGFPLALALVLPAISFSYMLLFFGLYDMVIEAIRLFRFNILIPLFIGIIIGAIAFSKLLLKLIDNNKNETYSFVLGFVLCSFADVLLTK